MKTVRFTYKTEPAPGYYCSEPNDQSGEYVKADVVRELLEAAEGMFAALGGPDNQTWRTALLKAGGPIPDTQS